MCDVPEQAAVPATTVVSLPPELPMGRGAIADSFLAPVSRTHGKRMGLRQTNGSRPVARLPSGCAPDKTRSAGGIAEQRRCLRLPCRFRPAPRRRDVHVYRPPHPPVLRTVEPSQLRRRRPATRQHTQHARRECCRPPPRCCRCRWRERRRYGSSSRPFPLPCAGASFVSGATGRRSGRRPSAGAAPPTSPSRRSISSSTPWTGCPITARRSKAKSAAAAGTLSKSTVNSRWSCRERSWRRW